MLRTLRASFFAHSTASSSSQFAPCLPSLLLADSARDYWPLSRARLSRRDPESRTSFGGGDQRIRRKPQDGVPAVEPERFARAASHVGGRSRIRLHGQPAREGTIHGDGAALGAAAREAGRRGASVSGAGGARNEDRGAANEIDRRGARNRSLGAAFDAAAARFATRDD